MKRFLTVGLVVVLVAVSVPFVRSLVLNYAGGTDARDTPAIDAANLKATRVLPYLETPIDAGTNVIWCGTFQLAWNELCSLVGEDLHFAGNEPETVALLNKKSFGKDDIDEASYVAVADFVRNDPLSRIHRELERKFFGRAQPRYLPLPAEATRPQDIVAYAFLFKNLEYPVVFQSISTPRTFADTSVYCFGIDYHLKPEQAAMYKNVHILDYRDVNDFVVELSMKSKEDRLILAKTQPGATLRETVDAVHNRMDGAQTVTAGEGDVLMVPKVEFDVSRRFTELIKKKLSIKNPTVAQDQVIGSAMQNIRFRMNERGVELQSEAKLVTTTAVRTQKKHIMIFDKPFLILLQRTDAKMPYFAMWVDNAELLQQTASSSR